MNNTKEKITKIFKTEKARKFYEKEHEFKHFFTGCFIKRHTSDLNAQSSNGIVQANAFHTSNAMMQLFSLYMTHDP